MIESLLMIDWKSDYKKYRAWVLCSPFTLEFCAAMTDIILHHYPESPFSEKIRLLLGYKGLDYHSVVIPIIMPKPDLMPLTGGYRKTPVMQIGADIYCDSAIIARVIDGMSSDNTIFPEAVEAVAGAIAHWTDTFFFKVSVAVAFQPRAMENNPVLSDPSRAQAFAADRAELSKGSTELRMAFEVAQPYFIEHLGRLDRQLAGGGFMLGAKPTIADFSTYHCLWFIQGNPVLRNLFDPFPNVRAWCDRMRGLGQGKGKTLNMTGAEAMAVARDASPRVKDAVESLDVVPLAAGDQVEIMPIDYGFNPVSGRLAVATAEELALRRTDDAVGEVAVHFPRLGFQIRKA